MVPVRLWGTITITLFQNLVFFNNPPSVTLGQLLEVMSWQFSSYVGRGLNSDQLNMLAEKLTGESRETGFPLVLALESFKAVMSRLLIITMSHFMKCLHCIANTGLSVLLLFLTMFLGPTVFYWFEDNQGSWLWGSRAVLWPDPCFSVALLFTLWFLGVLKPLPPNMLCGLYGDVNQSEQDGLSTGNVPEV